MNSTRPLVPWQTKEVAAGTVFCVWLARPAGLEPAAPSLEGSCSIHLSYGRVVSMVAPNAAPLMHPRIRCSLEDTHFPPNFRALNRGPLP